MVYQLFYYLVKLTCYFYFKKVRIYNPQNIGVKKPLIICANHGNSFMDAILIAINSKRTLHFLVRADVFNTPFKKWFFAQLNMMPIYRIRDGREALKNNESIFLKCRKVLENNGAIVIFPEGNCIVEKRLRAFKTGFVHLAFNTPLQNLQVLPVAINYSKPDEFYTDASLNFLKPISIEEVRETTQHDEFAFNKLLMLKTHDALKQQMVYIPENADDEFYEGVLLLKRNSISPASIDFIESQINLAEKLSSLKTNDFKKFKKIEQQVFHYFQKLKLEGIEDKAITEKRIPFLKWVLLFPFYFIGYWLNILPSKLLKNVVNTKIKEKQFKSSVRMVLSLFIYPVYIFAISCLLNLTLNNYAFSLAIITVLILIYYCSFSAFNIFKQQKAGLKNANDFKELRLLRADIVSALNL
ncbi:MAG TPA: 1-acyl-sn-glycerol-3-phosphate acyltransferase [Pelobium sp.]